MPITTNSPTGAEIYEARFGAEKKTWNDMRAHFGVSFRSSRFLAECGEYVRANADLLALHPEFAAIDGAAATDVENPEYRATRDLIRAERIRGVGFAMLADRTGLSVAQIRKIVGAEDVANTTARIGFRARYGGRKVPATDAPATDEDSIDVLRDSVDVAVLEAAADALGASGTSPEELQAAASDAVETMLAEGRAPSVEEEAETVAPAPKRRSRKRPAQNR